MLYVCMYGRYSPHIVSHCALKKWQSNILFSERISGILCYYLQKSIKWNILTGDKTANERNNQCIVK